MCYIEYNWTACAWSFRVGDRFIDFQDVGSRNTLLEWRKFLLSKGCRLIKLSDRTYEVVPLVS